MTDLATETKKLFDGEVDAVVRRIHDLADRVARVPDVIQGKGRNSEVAAQIHHELAWGVANLNADRLIRYGAEADKAVA